MHKAAITSDQLLAIAAALAIETLDLIGGDPDIELNGDELDGTHGEDDFIDYLADGPGCLVGDPGEPLGDEQGDPAWVEWQTRGRHKVGPFDAETLARDKLGHALAEDAEDDDADCCSAGDDIGTDHPPTGKMGYDAAYGDDCAEADHDGGEPLLAELPRYGIDQSLGPTNSGGWRRS